MILTLKRFMPIFVLIITLIDFNRKASSQNEISLDLDSPNSNLIGNQTRAWWVQISPSLQSNNLSEVRDLETLLLQPLEVANSFSGDRPLAEKSRLAQSLEMVEQMDNSQLKFILLNDLALDYAQIGEFEQAIAILDRSLSIAESFKEEVNKITAMNNIAKFYGQIGQKILKVLSL
jgi:tetratricopeptide (TPR) repeat protein